jgi:hypothetical protein
MTAPNLTLGKGLTIGKGITFGAGTGGGGGTFSFTLTSIDVGTTYNGGGISVASNTGFTVSAGSYSLERCNYTANLGSDNGGNDADYNNISTGWTNAGLDTFTGKTYAFNASWGPGGSPSSTVVLMSFYPFTGTNGQLVFAPVYTGNNNWQTSGQNLAALSGASGTYNLPVTFTLITPTIYESDNWC